MEQIVKCKSLTAIYKMKKGMFEGPRIVEFETQGEEQYHVKIDQCGIRKIVITSKEDISVINLHAVFSKVERLLMLFDGKFFPLEKIQLCGSETSKERELRSWEIHLLKGRLSYFTSADFCNYGEEKLIEFDNVMNADLFGKWEKLLDELDVVHQMYLYSLSDSKITIDVKCAFMIELAEPLVEVVKLYRNIFKQLTPGDDNTSLRKCLNAIIREYGKTVFESELSCKSRFNDVLTVLVNSRVRIMHIKRKQSKIYLNGNESVLYAMKMNLLYRCIIFRILNIERGMYDNKLKKCVSRIDNWSNVRNSFFAKISN